MLLKNKKNCLVFFPPTAASCIHLSSLFSYSLQFLLPVPLIWFLLVVLQRQFSTKSTMWISMCNAMQCQGNARKNMSGFFSGMMCARNLLHLFCSKPPPLTEFMTWIPARLTLGARTRAVRRVRDGRAAIWDVAQEVGAPAAPAPAGHCVLSPCLIVLPTALPLEPTPGPPLTSQSVIYVRGEVCALAGQCSINSCLVTFQRKPGSLKLKRV